MHGTAGDDGGARVSGEGSGAGCGRGWEGLGAGPGRGQGGASVGIPELERSESELLPAQ